jgi:PadR family transcriptional regulator, regulatory protein PadR
MTRDRALSPAARSVLALLLGAGKDWSHGYDLCREAGVKSGTLYPLLIRLEANGHLESQWLEPAAAGRPPRHAYRLTAKGRQLALDNPPIQPLARTMPLKGKLA